ncbi:Uncharacterized protein SCG7086_BM_00090 [Chlamydiales bacterium SCGC AG-110-P3]|nr:Uncharacterized protein SCG7086_BM_00090 [Chlamydiales bacterium SCGC AG-110-P3]
MTLTSAIIVTFIICTIFAQRCMLKNTVLYLPDSPTHRSLHHKTLSRSGGVAIYLAILAGAATAGCFNLVSWFIAIVLLGASGIAVISFLDDAFEVFCVYRFAMHLYAVSILFALPIIPSFLELPGEMIPVTGIFGIIFLVVAGVWMVNLYNFMDGMDGFAGGMGVIGFGTLGLIGLLNAHQEYALFNLVVTAACVAFLRYNRPPALLFMGDTGATLLGYLATVSALWGQQLGITPFWAFILLFSPFIIDATVTLTGRLFRLEKVWIGQRNHFYHQILLRLGHRRTVRGYYIVMLGCATTVVLTRNATSIIQWIAIIVWITFYIGAMLAVKRLVSQRDILTVMER